MFHGIDKTTAHELHNKRFNLILREEREEVLGVIEEIRSTNAKRMGKAQDLKYSLEGARKAKIDFEKIAVKFEGLNVTSPVNNAGAFMIHPGRTGVLVPLRRYPVLTVRLVSYRFEEWIEEHTGQVQANSLFSPSPRLYFHPSARLLVVI